MGANMSSDFENGNAFSHGQSSTNGFSHGKSSTSKVLTFNSSAKWKAHFNAVKETNKLLVIDFTATWCGPCQFMAPIIDEFASKYADVEFIKIDVDQLADVAREFEVETMPSFALLRNGKQVCKIVGARKDELEMMIEKHRAY